jgi:hypothetical protein
MTKTERRSLDPLYLRGTGASLPGGAESARRYCAAGTAGL